MGPAVGSRILLCGLDTPAAEEVRRHLEEAGHHVTQVPFEASGDGDLPGYQLVVVEGSRSAQEAAQCCRRLRARLPQGLAPVLCILDDPSPSARLASLDAGADTNILRPFARAELLAQVQAFLRIQQLHARLADQTAELHQTNLRLYQAQQQINLELEAARRLQTSFLPQTLPEVHPARFAVSYRPSGRVGGDFYDVFRLDENHVGFYVADAMGHGVPASLLTIFLKRGVQPKDITGRSYRLVPPAEVLQRLNTDLIEQQLAEVPFITMLYVLLNCADGTLRFARGGHPPPLYLPAEGAPETWQGTGSLLGVFATEFAEESRTLRPRDKLLLYTDGLDTASAASPVIEEMRSCAARHRALPIDQFVRAVSQDLLALRQQEDDFTLLGVEMAAE